MRPPRFASVTVVESVYHRTSPDHKPLLVDCRSKRTLASDDQPYQRFNLDVGEDWQPLKFDPDWVGPLLCGLLIIKNEPTRFAVNPTPEQRTEAASRVLEVSVSGSAPWLVFPGETFRGVPSDLSLVRVRCRKGSAKYSLTLLVS